MTAKVWRAVHCVTMRKEQLVTIGKQLGNIYYLQNMYYDLPTEHKVLRKVQLSTTVHKAIILKF